MSNITPHKYPLYYDEIASNLCMAIDRLRRAKSCEELDEAIRGYHRSRCAPDFDEFQRWVCQRRSEIISLRAVPFHFRPDPEKSPWLDWAPALYALTCVVGEIVDPLLSLHQREKLSRALKNFNGATMEVECAHELIHLHEKDMAVPHGPGSGTRSPTATLPVLLSAADIARYVQQPKPRIESFLRRYRTDHRDCFIEVDSPRRNKPRYLYRTEDVMKPLQAKLET